MAAENVPLTEHAQEVVASVIQSGDLKDAAEVVDFALRRLEQERAAQAAKFKAFREAAQVGWDDIDAGRYDDVADKDLDAYVAGLSTRARRVAESS